MSTRVADAIETLKKEQPSFHGETEAGTRNWALARETLEWIGQSLPENATTLETGCGYSTVTFVAAGAAHHVISPFPQEHELIRKWCMGHQIELSRVRFHASPSVDVLPRMPREPLDMVLIDGAHEFPVPFIDWYYTADRVKRGGHMIVDDTHLPTGYILRDFLMREEGRWELAMEIGRTSTFRKTTDKVVARGIQFWEQPWCQLDLSMKGRIKNKLRKLVGGKK
jgi:hypothetical protein